jgi:hypothetical protein
MDSQFDTDDEGNIILQPVTGWAVGPVAESAILLQIQYSESAETLETAPSKQFQFVLTPPKCLELGEMLTKHALRLIEDSILPPGKLPN